MSDMLEMEDWHSLDQHGVGVPAEHLLAVLDVQPALRRGGDSKLDHVGGLLLIHLVIVALILLNCEELHGKQRVLALGGLDEWQVGILKADVVLGGVVGVHVCVVLLAVLVQSLELVLLRVQVKDKALDAD